MAGKDRKVLILIGLSGAGKSEAGRALAERLGVDFVDLDEMVERRTGMTIPQIFDELGEAAFREEEHRALEGLANIDSCIIATGGGVVERPDNRQLLKKLGTVVWLRVDPAVAVERLDPHTRPLLAQARDPVAKLEEIASKREPLYEEICDYRVDANRDTERIADELQHIWNSL